MYFLKTIGTHFDKFAYLVKMCCWQVVVLTQKLKKLDVKNENVDKFACIIKIYVLQVKIVVKFVKIFSC